MKRVFNFILLILVAHVTMGQHIYLNDSAESFGTQIATFLERTNNREASSIGQDFNALWPNSFSVTQQSQIMKIAIGLQDMKYNAIPYQRDFFGALTSGVNLMGLSEIKLDNFLSMISKSLDRSTARNFSREMVNLRTFFELEALHFTRANSLYAFNGEYDFEFVDPAEAQTYEDLIIEKAEENEDESADEGWEESADGDWEDSSDAGWGDSEDSWGDDSDDGWGDSDNLEEEDESTNWTNVDEEGETDIIALTFDESSMDIDLPKKVGAIISFTQVDLVIVSRYDSTTIAATNGSFLLDKYVFVGEEGRFDWTSAGKDPDEIYVNLDKYSFNTRNPYLEAVNVKLSYANKIDKVVKGYFEFKSVRHKSVEDAKYPKFISYENDIRVENLGDDNLVFIGGITLEGGTFIGASAYGKDSKMEYSDEEGKKFKIYSKLFNFRDSVITSYNSRVSIYHGRDSITHPSVKTRFYTNDKRFVVIKDKNGYNIRPFNASYFNMTIEADMINWDMNSDSMNITIMNAKSLLPSYYKSIDYYDFEEIKELSGIYNFNPLLVVYSYGAKQKTREFYVTNLIEDLNLNEKAVRGAMRHLMYLDFIEYDNIGGRIFLKDKAIHFVRSKNNKKDYDDLMISSLSPDKPNSTLHLDTDELTVRGIDKFFISQILDVYIFPNDNEITLLKNRDFKFDGRLFAGNFEFVGRNFTFRYDSFLVDLANIDSIKFYIDGEGEYEKKQVGNKLVSLDLYDNSVLDLTANGSTTGTLYINRPDNKSGGKIFPQYPVFDADRGAIVYFDNEDMLGGAYDRSVYFVVPPFGIDSLSSSDPATIGFDGTFITGGILPEFKETLRIMPDNSLGFEHVIPQDGFELYGGTAKIYHKVQLNNSGLVGNGRINYLTSSSYSENYVFYLDSMVTEGTNFKIKEGDLNGVSYPDIYTDNYEMIWHPHEDHMIVKNQLDSFRLYDNSATLNGFIDLSANGVNGGGTMTTRGFESQSDEFTFSETDLIAKHSFFELASDNPEKPLLTGDDIRLEFNFDTDIANISPEIEGMAAIEFPYAQIKTSIQKAQWNLKEQKVYMTKPPDVAIENSYFYATRKELDSLAFNAESAVYDLQTSELKVSGIPYIIVGDAMITPENNEVLILENAQLGEIYNTTIVIDTLNEYHRLINGTIQIHSRTKFTGDATYEFVNAVKDTFNIKFGKFELWKDPEIKGSQLQTVSSGVIGEDFKLRISEGLYFKGDVTMYARNRALKLDGYVQFDLPSRQDYSTWVKYSSMDEETQDVMFSFNQAVTENGKLLNAGIHYNIFNDELYATFAEEKSIDADEDFFSPDGIMYFNAEKGMFMIEDTAKTNGNKFSGKVFGYNDATGAIDFEGPVNFVESSENAKLTASGFGSGNVKDGSFEINSLLKFDYDIPNQALMVMAADLFEVIENFGAPEAENNPDAFLYKIAEFIGERATMEYDQRSQGDYLPIASFTSKMAGSLVFSKVNMEWSTKHNAWYSKNKLGLSNILRSDINASIDGFIEIKRSAEHGNIMNIFIQASSDCWYYFGFEDNRLMLYSSNDEFVDIIVAKSNINKAGFGEYAFLDADLPDVLKFIDRFRLDYLGIKEPYEIRMPVEEISERLDFLAIPVDNTEDGDMIPMEIEDNTEESLRQDTQPVVDEPMTEEDLLNPAEPQTEEDLLNPAEPQTEEDLLNPATEPEEEVEEDDDEGF